MKKIFTILFLLPTLCFSQVYINNNAVKISSNGNIETDGYTRTDSIAYNVIPARVTAYIDSSVATTITEAGTWYFMQGVFVNNYSENFSAIGDTLIYTNGNGKYLYIGYSFSLSSSENNTTASVAISVDGVIIGGSECEQLMKIAGEDYNFSSMFLTHINTNDKIKILVKSNKSSSILTAVYGSTVAFQIP